MDWTLIGRTPSPPFTFLVAALGVAQIVSWGTLFYAVGVFGASMARDLGVSQAFVFASFTGALLVSGTLSPIAGKLVDSRGGRTVLSAGSLLAAASMAVLAIAGNSVEMIGGWVLAGAAMAGCLYDPAFATLAHHTGKHYRKAITAITTIR